MSTLNFQSMVAISNSSKRALGAAIASRLTRDSAEWVIQTEHCIEMDEDPSAGVQDSGENRLKVL